MNNVSGNSTRKKILFAVVVIGLIVAGVVFSLTHAPDSMVIAPGPDWLQHGTDVRNA